MAGPLDMALDSDRRVLVRSMSDGVTNRLKRWSGIDDQLKVDAVKALRVALRLSLEKQDHRAINGCVKTLAFLEGQNQADEHFAEKKPDVSVIVQTATWTVPPPRAIGDK